MGKSMKNSDSKNQKSPLVTNSRRGFVKNTALFTGGAMLLPNMQMNAMVNVLNDKKLKLALVGCGGRGTGAAVQALTADENIELVAMADAFEDRLQSSLTSQTIYCRLSFVSNVIEKPLLREYMIVDISIYF